MSHEGTPLQLEHDAQLQCSCAHALIDAFHPLDPSVLHLDNSCYWVCCGASWKTPGCSNFDDTGTDYGFGPDGFGPGQGLGPGGGLSLPHVHPAAAGSGVKGAASTTLTYTGQDNYSLFLQGEGGDDEKEEIEGKKAKQEAKQEEKANGGEEKEHKQAAAAAAAHVDSSLSSRGEALGPIGSISHDLDIPLTLRRLNTLGREEELSTLPYATELIGKQEGQGVDGEEKKEDEDDEEANILCAPLDGLKATNFYASSAAGAAAAGTGVGGGGGGGGGGAASTASIRKIIRELSRDLPKALVADARGTIFVRYDADHPQYLRALITGAEGTVYASGLFVFDLFLPVDYPAVPLNVVHVTKNANTLSAPHSPGGFSPNLHSDTGKVCLSLLGTWAGPGWEVCLRVCVFVLYEMCVFLRQSSHCCFFITTSTHTSLTFTNTHLYIYLHTQPNKSNIFQVLTSIQTCILGAGVHKHPYYLEPGHGGWEGNAPTSLDRDPNAAAVVKYDELLKISTARLCILQPLKDVVGCCKGFEKVALKHLLAKRKIIMATLDSWIRKAGAGSNLPSLLSPIEKQITEAYFEQMSMDEIQGDLAELQSELKFIRKRLLALGLHYDSIDVSDDVEAALAAPTENGKEQEPTTSILEKKLEEGAALVNMKQAKLSFLRSLLCDRLRLRSESATMDQVLSLQEAKDEEAASAEATEEPGAAVNVGDGAASAVGGAGGGSGGGGGGDVGGKVGGGSEFAIYLTAKNPGANLLNAAKSKMWPAVLFMAHANVDLVSFDSKYFAGTLEEAVVCKEIEVIDALLKYGAVATQETLEKAVTGGNIVSSVLFIFVVCVLLCAFTSLVHSSVIHFYVYICLSHPHPYFPI